MIMKSYAWKKLFYFITLHFNNENKILMTTVNDEQNHTTKLEKDFNKNMARLQQYLSTDGKELKYETQLRAFFALPYIEDPLSDPLFREILDKSWIEKLSIHLQEFIAKYVQVNNINL